MHRFLAACSLLFLLPFSVRASGPAFISELAWAGSSASLADEWLEVCGAPGTDLSGWSIEGAAAGPIALPEGSAIPASGAYLVANYADTDARSTLAVAPDLVTTAVALSNAALAVTLRDAGGAAIDVAGAGSAPPAGTSGDAKASMERADASLPGDDPAAWISAAASSGFDAGASELGTPGSCLAASPAPEPPAAEEEPPTDSATDTQETSEPAPPRPPQPEPMSAVRISEVYPSPESGEAEWLELVNRSGTGEFLDGLTVEDARGTKTPLEGLLLPWARRVITSPKGSLNNDGDLVVLRDRSGRMVERVEYPKTARGEAFMRVEMQDAFVMTVTPTPGTENVFSEAAEEAPEPPEETVDPAVHAEPASPPLSFRPSEASGGIAPIRRDPAAALGMTGKPEDAPRERVVPAEPAPKKPAAKPKAAASRYKGSNYSATVVVPPGIYAKTRAYIQRDGSIEELRLSKGPSSAWSVGDRIAFVAQAKTEGAVAFLLANPNSVRMIGSASATFAATDAWPKESGGYGFTAEVSSIRGDALEVRMGGVEGDVLVPSGTAAALKPGDTVRVEGFVAAGPRPRVVLPYAHALRLFKARLPEDAVTTRSSRLPLWASVGLTTIAAAVGLIAYLRMQRLKRLALTQAGIDPIES